MRNNLFLGVAVAALVIPAAASAQETTSSIRGTVTSSGAPIAGAQVVVVHVPSGSRSTATTDEGGSFNVTGLRVGGPYTVSVTSASGNTEVTDISTDIGQTFDLPIELASSGPDIVVTAQSIARAGSVSQGPATVLTAKDIANIATTNRDIRDLARRDPFARLDDTPGGGRAVSFAGQNARFNKFSVDGVPITDNFGLNPDGLPSRRSPIPIDAIGQFQTKVAPYDVREGNFQGGAINIVLRSGGNDFQGTGFYSVTGDGLTGKKTKAGPGVPTGVVTLPKFKSEDYGVQLSGPIIKDRLFFMVAGERIRAGTPIPEGPIDNNAGTAIPGLTQAVVDKIVAIAKSKYGYDAGGVLNNSKDSDDRVVAKLDANISDTQRASLTYSYTKDLIQFNQNAFTTPLRVGSRIERLYLVQPPSHRRLPVELRLVGGVLDRSARSSRITSVVRTRLWVAASHSSRFVPRRAPTGSREAATRICRSTAPPVLRRFRSVRIFRARPTRLPAGPMAGRSRLVCIATTTT